MWIRLGKANPYFEAQSALLPLLVKHQEQFYIDQYETWINHGLCSHPC